LVNEAFCLSQEVIGKVTQDLTNKKAFDIAQTSVCHNLGRKPVFAFGQQGVRQVSKQLIQTHAGGLHHVIHVQQELAIGFQGDDRADFGRRQ